MKELYTSPEAKITYFAPVENLANNEIEFMAQGNISAVTELPGDLDFGLDEF